VLEKIAEALRRHDKFVVSTHVNPDGDAIGSCLALKWMLDAMGKTAWVINPESTPEKLQFLDPENTIVVYDAPICDPILESAEVHCTVDVSEPGRVGSVLEPLRAAGLVEIVIDHHPGNNHKADLAYIDPQASATGLLLCDLIETLGLPLSPRVAELLYVAIMTDTGSFRYTNTDGRTHRATARLIEAGAEPQRLYSAIYERDSIERFRLYQKVIGTAQFAAGGQLAWMVCPKEFFEQTGTRNTDLEDFVNTPRSLKTVEVSILFSQPRSGTVRISMRSKNRLDVSRLAARFGGGGHVRAAGAVVEMSLEEAQKQVLQTAEQMLLETATPKAESEEK